ncbi:MAG: glutamate--tRNA ligase [bacterium]
MNENNTPKIVVRFAPSPTGPLHVGSIRAALFNYIFAKQNNGKYILRIEDTDKERSKKEYEDGIIESFAWLDLPYDEIYRQSERTDIYKKYLQQLVESGHAYISKEESLEEGKRSEVIRFKNPNKKVTFHDLIRGEVTFDTTELKDFVIAKSLEEPLYHLAVVIDDHEMGITHIIRGEDHISNTPRQILIQEAIGAIRPIYAHLPLILAADRSKLSKRKHGEFVSLSFYRNKGYLKEAIINFMALLGWNPGTDQELFSIEDLVKQFDIARVQKSGAIFDTTKLDWLNREYIKKMPTEEITALIKTATSKWNPSESTIQKLLPIVLDRITTLADIETMEELEYLFAKPTYEKDSLLCPEKLRKGSTAGLPEVKNYLQESVSILEKIPEDDFIAEKIKTYLWDYATEKGRGLVLWSIRYALSGKEKSPDPFTLADILGKKETLDRIQSAISLL